MAEAADTGDKGPSAISKWLTDLRESVTDISATGVTILKTQQGFKNTIADNKNQDALNATIASYSSPNSATEVARARREALANAEASGSGAAFGNNQTLLILAVVGIAAFIYLKKG